jgi:hypothetical protein
MDIIHFKKGERIIICNSILNPIILMGFKKLINIAFVYICKKNMNNVTINLVFVFY